MGAPMTDLPIVQFAKLTTEQRVEALARIFTMIEYDDNYPGREISDGDIGRYVQDIFNEYGVRFTDVNQMPSGYRFNQHKTDDGTWCPTSGCSTAEPMSRPTPGDIHCPNGCTASVVEVDTEITGSEINVEALLLNVARLGVPARAYEDRAGEYIVRFGEGHFDEAAERWTHPMSLGPCQRNSRGVLVGLSTELTYGPNLTEEDDYKYVDDQYGDVDPQKVAEDIAGWYRQVTGTV